MRRIAGEAAGLKELAQQGAGFQLAGERLQRELRLQPWAVCPLPAQGQHIKRKSDKEADLKAATRKVGQEKIGTRSKP